MKSVAVVKGKIEGIVKAVDAIRKDSNIICLTHTSNNLSIAKIHSLVGLLDNLEQVIIVKLVLITSVAAPLF